MKKIITLALIVAAITGLTTTSQAQKIGYLSTDEIIVLMPEAAKVDTQLNEYQQSLYLNAQEMQTTLNEAVQKFYADSAKMTTSMKEVKRTELQKQVQELSGMDQKIQNQFEQKRQELSMPIQKKLQGAIQEVAKENGYSYVFPREALLAMPPADDIGTLVKKKLGVKDLVRPATPIRK